MFNKLKILKMKKIKFLFVALFALMGVNNAFAQAKPLAGATLSDDNYYYEVIANGDDATKTAELRITALNGDPEGTTVDITGSFTKKYDGVTWTLNVTRIADEVFKDQTTIEVVNFPVQMQEIGAKVFLGCTLLREINFPVGSKLRKIYTKAFATTQITDPDFTNCTQLQQLPDYLFAESDAKPNNFVKTVKLPTGTMFTKLNKALANLPSLTTTNIKDTKITEIVAEAFLGDAKLEKMELPGTVKTIKTNAFQKSSVKDLTINLTSIEEIQATVYGSSAATVLKKLTFTNDLKGVIRTDAFKGVNALGSDLTTAGYETSNVLDMHSVNLGTTASIETGAFSGAELKKVWLGKIENNATGNYTIGTTAFTGAKLTDVEIGDITTIKAINANAFGESANATLTTVTIGNIYSAGDGTDFPIKAGAFQFGDASTLTLTIGNVRTTDTTNPIMDAGAFKTNYSAADAPLAFNIKIGAVESKGNTFKAGSIDNTDYPTTIEFTGNIEQSGLDVAILVKNENLTAITFDGGVAAGGIKAGAFAGIAPVYVPATAEVPAHPSLVVTFVGELAPAAVEDGAFTIATAPLGDGNVPVMKVWYKSATHSNTFKEGMPFGQKSFYATCIYAEKRDILMVIDNEDLAKTFAENQFDSPTKDIVYRVMLPLPEPTNFITVYGDNNNLGTSYARIQLPAGKYKIDRRPVAKTIEGEDQSGITYTLYTVYKEEDEPSKLTTLNMLPMVSNDGFYYVDLSAPTVIIVKAQGTEKVADKETKMWYEEWTGSEPKSNVYNGDGCVKIATKVVTNQQLNDGTGNTGVEALTSALLGANNVYLLTNPAAFNGLRAVALDYSDPKPFINKGNFYALGKKYAAAGRMIINWFGENDATAIVAAKTSNDVQNGAIYTLQGIRVNAVKKGQIYIQNGKKYIAK